VLFHRKIKVPDCVFKAEKRVLHVSDTPVSFYRTFDEILNLIKPDIIIHTGDLADDIKLERKPWLKKEYENALIKFKNIIRGRIVYLVPGNEDDKEIIREILGRDVILVNPGTIIEIYGRTFALGHKPEDVKGKEAEFKLYGHDPKSLFPFNGIHAIHIILFPEWKVVKIRYPSWVNYDRGYRIFRGL